MKGKVQAHDKFFKASLSYQSVAKDFLKAHLPKKILKRIDLNTLEMTNQSFVDNQLNNLHSDVIYKAMIDDSEGYIYVLLEHQSRPDQLMAFRKHMYCMQLISQALKQGAKKCPVVIPICVYHGKQSPYPYSTDVIDCFDDKKLASKYFAKPFQSIDLSVMPDDEIIKHGHAALLETLLKHAWQRDLYQWVQLTKEAYLWEIADKIDGKYTKTALQYIIIANDVSSNALLDTLIQLLPEQSEVIMTAGEELIQKGMLQGIQKGRQEGRQEGRQLEQKRIISNLIKQGFSVDKIAVITGLSGKEVMMLVHNDDDYEDI